MEYHSRLPLNVTKPQAAMLWAGFLSLSPVVALASAPPSTGGGDGVSGTVYAGGGVNSPTGPGGDGTAGTGGGGGAGSVGGTGAGVGAGPTGGAGGATPGASGADSSSGGGGGGAHGYVGSSLPSLGVTGGNGGNARTTAPVAGGGAGGYGAVITGSGDLGTLTVNLKGGNGGNGTCVVSGTSCLGMGGGGSGGAGLYLVNTLPTTLTVAPGIQVSGGAGGGPALACGVVPAPCNFGAFGSNGVGITGSNLSLINNGAISGGLVGPQTTRGPAIVFTGGTNTLEISASSSIVGNVIGTGTDTFRLGGAADGSFKPSSLGGQYQGFNAFEKTGSSTWTLIDNGSGVTPWTISQGKLVIAGESFLGSSAGLLTLAGGTLETSEGFVSNRNIALGLGGGTLQADKDDLTLMGVISDSGASSGGLTKSGTGTMALFGANTYTGATRIAAGTLALRGGVGSIANSSGLTVDANAQFDIAGLSGSGAIVKNLAGAGMVTLGSRDLTVGVNGASSTFSGSISGSGNLIKVGTGALILSGANSLSGGFTVNDGVLEMNGSAPNASLAVNAAATVRGIGSVGGSATVASSSVIASLNPTPLHIGGNLTLGSGSTYQVMANAAGQSGQVTVGGVLNIGAAKVQVLASPGSYARNTRYTIMTAAGGVTGRFSNITSNFAFLTPTLTYAANSVDLVLVNNTDTLQSVAVSANQAAVATAIELSSKSGSVYDAIVLQTPDGARQAFDALSGEVYATTATIELDQGRYMRDAVSSRLRQAYLGAAVGLGPVAEEMGTEHRMTAWAQVLGARSRSGYQDGGHIAFSRYNTSGVLVGADGRLGDWRVGGALGHQQTDLGVSDRSSHVSVDSTRVAVYAAAPVIGRLKIGASLDYAWNRLSSRRTVAFPGFQENVFADYDSQTLDAFAEVAYGLSAGRVAIEPYARLAWTQVNTPGFAETGGTSVLRSSDVKVVNTFSQLGARVETSLRFRERTLARPYLAIGWRHAFREGQARVPLRLTSAGAAFAVKGAAEDPEAGDIETGVVLNTSFGAILTTAYTGEISNRWQDHQAKITILYPF